jgi:hypothetical protein
MSLGLPLAVSLLWIRSYKVSERIGWRTNEPCEHAAIERFTGITIYRGSIWLERFDDLLTSPTHVELAERRTTEQAKFKRLEGPVPLSAVNPGAAVSFAGFGLCRETVSLPWMSGKHFELGIPFWAFLVAASLPVVVLNLRTRSQIKRRYRMRLGLCVRCGYDLRATAGRCPECGTAVPVRARPGIVTP